MEDLKKIRIEMESMKKRLAVYESNYENKSKNPRSDAASKICVTGVSKNDEQKNELTGMKEALLKLQQMIDSTMKRLSAVERRQDDLEQYLLLLSASSYSGSPQRDSNLHFTRSTSSPSLAPTLSMSSLTKSIHLLLGLPLFLLPGTAISIILFPSVMILQRALKNIWLCFTPDALPVATLPIYPGLGPAPRLL